MITCRLEPLSAADDNKLRLWLGKGEFELLQRVILGRVQAYEVDFLAQSLESGPDNDKKTAAESALLNAQRYHHALEVLKELHERKEGYEVAKLA